MIKRAARSIVRALRVCALSSIALLPSLALTACSKEPQLIIKEPDPCKLQMVNLSVIASPRVNPTDDGASRPVVVRIYQLKSDTRLLHASFEEMWQRDKETLQDDFVKVDETPIFPDTRTELKFERDEKAMVIAAVALFRSPKGRSWLTTFELPPPPGKGDCGMPKCQGPSCADAGREPPKLLLRFGVWLDATKIDDGADHLDDYPNGGRIREIMLRFNEHASDGRE